jgi:hypothetical protein
MQRDSRGQRDAQGMNLSAVFVDYDNIYLSLKRKNEEAAKRFSKDASVWIRAIESGQLITPTNGPLSQARRRIVMNRCYGNPVPKRNANDNSTDMSSFPFVRHHFLRAGFEIVDCPPLTAQLKNSSDIRMVMDMRDYMHHDTYFDEFIILSGDADFTPVLHRLRQHARRTVIFANDHTATPYTAICDGEVRESDLIALLLGTDGANLAAPPSVATPSARLQTDTRGAAGVHVTNTNFAIEAPLAQQPHVHQQVVHQPVAQQPVTQQYVAHPADAHQHVAQAAAPRAADLRQLIVAEVVASVRSAPAPIPLETLADRAVRAMGHDRTAGTHWGGAGTFRDLLRQDLPTDVRVSDNAPFVAFDTRRHGLSEPVVHRQPEMTYANTVPAPAYAAQHPSAPRQAFAPARGSDDAAIKQQAAYQSAAAAPPSAIPARSATPTPMQQTIMRIYEASQAPQIAPAEYRVLFEGMAQEINENQLNGDTTLQNIVIRARDRGVDVQSDDVRFVLEVVGETDPWFEQGASANLFAGRFRNYIVGRCRETGMKLSAAELDMIDSWFAPAVGVRMADRVERGLAKHASVAHVASATVAPTDVTPRALAVEAPAPQFVAPHVSPVQHTSPVQHVSATQHAPVMRSVETQPRGSRWWAFDAAKAEAGRAETGDGQGVALRDDDDFPRIARNRVRT